jgi:hypothetical protein
MHLMTLITWLLLISTESADVKLLQHRRGQLALTASSPFRMIISRTDNELSPTALNILEEATASHLLDQSYETISTSSNAQKIVVKAVDIVIQVADFQSDTSSTRIKLFALATFTALADTTQEITEANVAVRQEALNSLVVKAFASKAFIDKFLQQIRESVMDSNDVAVTEQLRGIDSVVISSVAPAPSPSTDNDVTGADEKKTMFSIDKILIAVSTCILIGIVWMIVLYYKDLGYFTRSPDHDVLNSATGSFPNDAASFPHVPYDTELNASGQAATTADIFLSHSEPLFNPEQTEAQALVSNGTPSRPDARSSSSNEDNVMLVAFSTASTAIDADPALDRTELRSQEVSKAVLSSSVFIQDQLDEANATSDASTAGALQQDSPRPLNGAVNGRSNGSHEQHISLTEPFETNVFRTDASVKDESTAVGDVSIPNRGSSASNDSDDVFQVDVAAAEAATVDSASKHSSTQEIIDWMKSVHVVTMSGDRSTSVMTTSTDGQSSSRSSSGKKSTVSVKSEMDTSVLDVSSLGQVSLERSMASSTQAESKTNGVAT